MANVQCISCHGHPSWQLGMGTSSSDGESQNWLYYYIIYIYIYMYYIILCYVILYYILFYFITLHYILLYFIILYYIISYCIISYYIILYHIILYYNIVYYIIIIYIDIPQKNGKRKASNYQKYVALEGLTHIKCLPTESFDNPTILTRPMAISQELLLQFNHPVRC